LVPVALPFVTGMIRLEGQRLGLYHPEVGGWLFALANIAVFTLGIWWVAGVLRRAEADRVRAVGQLRESATGTQDLYDNAPCGYHSVGPDGVVIAINQTELRWVGYDAADVVGRVRFSDFLAPGSREAYRAAFAHLREYGSVSDVELELTRRDGTTFPVLASATSVRDAAGGYVMSRTTLTDLTERKRAENAVRLFADVTEHIPVGLLVYQLDAADPPTLRVRSGNPFAARVLGVPLGEAAGRLVTDVFPAIPDELVRRYATVAASGVPDDLGEFRYGDDRVAERWWAVQAFPLPERSVGVAFQDVTDRKRAENEVRRLNADLEQRVRDRTAELTQANAALREEEELFRSAFDNTNVAMVLTDLDNRFVRANAAFAGLFGYTLEEVRAIGLAEVTYPDDMPGSLSRREELLAGSRDYFQMEKRYRHKDGRVLWGLTNVALVRDALGRPRMYVGQLQDITERKKAETALRERADQLAESEARLAGVIDSAKDAVIVVEAGRRVGLFNPAAERMFGCPAAAALGRPLTDFIPDELAPPDAGADPDAVSMTRRLRMGTRGVRAGGEAFPLEASASSGRVGGRKFYTVVVRDVTERVRAEEALRLRDRAIRTVSQGILITDPNRPDNPIVYVSPGFERMTGYGADEAVGRNCRFLQGRDTDPEAVARIREAVRVSGFCTVEVRNYRKNGTAFWNEVSISPVRNDHGLLTHFVGVQTDVTERRALQEQLRQSQKMDAFGQLAGGVAHDFNNLLTVINGYADILLATLAASEDERSMLDAIRDAGERAVGLTAQLLAFSRKAIVEPRVLDPNAVVAETGKMLRRLIGEDVSLATALDPAV
ncbi:MAG TPA: PAS domain S-box protein, partial [Gemmataceae bacterium]|nr:PAS domain S-box protein [Gemmataceae bacterium]